MSLLLPSAASIIAIVAAVANGSYSSWQMLPRPPTRHSVGGRPVNIDGHRCHLVNIHGHRGHLPNKLLFRRDARLARDDDRLMTAPFPHCLETATATAPRGATPCPPPEHGCVRRVLDSVYCARTCDGPCWSTAGPRTCSRQASTAFLAKKKNKVLFSNETSHA